MTFISVGENNLLTAFSKLSQLTLAIRQNKMSWVSGRVRFIFWDISSSLKSLSSCWPNIFSQSSYLTNWEGVGFSGKSQKPWPIFLGSSAA